MEADEAADLRGRSERAGRITHSEALGLIDSHLGERVYVGFMVSGARPEEGIHPVDAVVAGLSSPFAGRPPRLEADFGAYSLGHGRHIYLPPMSGTIELRDHGVDFRVAGEATIRVAWRGSAEIGDAAPARLATPR